MAFSFDKLIYDKKYGYIFKEDFAFLEDNLKDGDWEKDNIKNCKDTCFHFGLLPPQILGDVNNAKVFLLNLNPSFGDNDFEDEKMLQKYLKDTIDLNFTSMNLKEYPFYFLNPEIKNTGGAKWWNKHFSSYKKYKDFQFTDQLLSKSFCCIELIPYHARKLPIATRNFYKCPSVIRVKGLFQELKEKAKKKEIVVICLRSAKEWGFVEDKENNLFMGRNAQTATFSTNGDYMKEIVRLCRNTSESNLY